MPAAAKKLEYLTKEQACQQLGLKERRLRDYIAAGKIRQSDDGLHAGDVAKLQEERSSKKAIVQAQAIANVPSRLSSAQREQLAKAAAAARQGDTKALARLQDGAVAKRQPAKLPEARPFDGMPGCVRLGLHDAAEYLRVPRSVILAAVEDKRLPCLRIPHGTGFRYLIKRADLDHF